MKTYNKLVRDSIPEICAANGEEPLIKVLSDDGAYLAALTAKLGEEANEVQADPCLDELADVLEVAYAIGKALGYTPAQIEAARKRKAHERGGFDKRIFLISTEHKVQHG